jgi:GDP-L-fucose synthase
VGSAAVRRLRALGYEQLPGRTERTELTRQSDVEAWFSTIDRRQILAAARVGGILANNSYPADFIRDNLVVQNNVIDAAYRNGTRKLTFWAPAAHPGAPQPLDEDSLLTGPLEPTNEWYAIAKIAGIKMCQAYQKQYGFDAISLMPTNLYGPGDNFGLESSHVLPALIRKFHEARRGGQKSVVIWGTGTPRREFLYVDDLADAVVFLTQSIRARASSTSAWAKMSRFAPAERVGKVVGLYELVRPLEARRHAAKTVERESPADTGWRATTTLMRASSAPMSGSAPTKRKPAPAAARSLPKPRTRLLRRLSSPAPPKSSPPWRSATPI